MTVRLFNLDADGNPTGEVTEVKGITVSMVALSNLQEQLAPVIQIASPTRFCTTINLVGEAWEQLRKMLFPKPRTLKERRRVRHQARIVHVPKRRYKHGRVGVFK